MDELAARGARNLGHGEDEQTRRFVWRALDTILSRKVPLGFDESGYIAGDPFPYFWRLDGADIAAGIARVHPKEAAGVITYFLRESQWENGLVPQILFPADENGVLRRGAYFPNPEHWMTQEQTRHIVGETSGILQLPFFQTASLEVAECLSRDYGPGKAKEFLTQVYDNLKKDLDFLHTLRDPEGVGLPSIFHPWAGNMDNSGRFIPLLTRISWESIPSHVKETVNLYRVDDKNTARLGHEEIIQANEEVLTMAHKSNEELVRGRAISQEQASTLPETLNDKFLRLLSLKTVRGIPLVDKEKAKGRPSVDFYYKAYHLVTQMAGLGWDQKKIYGVVDFNVKDVAFCSMYAKANEDMAEIAKTLGRAQDTQDFKTRARQTRKAMNKYMWNGRMYCDLDVTGGIKIRDMSDEMLNNIRITEPTTAALFPLYGRVPDAPRAKKVLTWSRTKGFWTEYPLTSTSPMSMHFDPGRYWRGPSWPGINIFIYRGLLAYGMKEQAQLLRETTLEACRKSRMPEYYHPETGKPTGSLNFPWTASAVLQFLDENLINKLLLESSRRR